jgi:hypothetical protein
MPSFAARSASYCSEAGCRSVYVWPAARRHNRFCQPCDACFGDRYFRFVNNQDIVPRVPRALGYADAAHVEYIDAEGVIHDRAVLDLAAVDVTGFQALKERDMSIEEIADHSMTLYLGHIRAVWDKAQGTV